MNAIAAAQQRQESQENDAGSDSYRQREAASHALLPVVPLVYPELSIMAQGGGEGGRRAQLLIQHHEQKRRATFRAAVLPPTGKAPWCDMLCPHYAGEYNLKCPIPVCPDLDPKAMDWTGADLFQRYFVRATMEYDAGPTGEWPRYREATDLYLNDLFAIGADPARVREMLAEMQVLEVEWSKRDAATRIHAQPER